MHVNSINLKNFRNFKSVYLELSPEINVISGNNGQGKTNLIESIQYMSEGKSFRAKNDKELINFQSDTAEIFLISESDNRENELYSRISRTERKKFEINGIKENAAALSGRLSTVVFSPDDLYLVKGGSVERRRFIDSAISQLRPKYSAAISEYRKLYTHKSRILKDCAEKPSLLDMLDTFNYRMALVGAEIIYYRAAWCEKIKSAAADIYREISSGEEILNLEYKTVSNIDNPLKKPAELMELLLEHQASHKAAEIASAQCLSGPHKDDIEIYLSGKQAKSFASQGQTRSAALSLKLAERDINKSDRGEAPVLLLDDVLSELDAKRKDFVLNRISGGQVVITCCDEKEVSGRFNLIFVHNGDIVR